MAKKEKCFVFFIFVLITGTTCLNSMDQEIEADKEAVRKILSEHNKKGFTELMSAARFLESFEKAQQLIKRNPDVNQKNAHGRTALMVAVGRRNWRMVPLLIESKADINGQDNNGETALMKAAKIDSMEMVMLLLVEPKIKLGLKDRLGRTALDFTKSQASRGKAFNVAGLLVVGEEVEKITRESGVKVLKNKTERKQYFHGFLRRRLKEE